MPISNAQLQALVDLTVGSSTNGAAIPICYGQNIVSGNLIWCPGLSETVVSIPQKDSNGNTHLIDYYTYTASLGMAFCEGVGNILQIWGETTVLFDQTGTYVDYQGVFSDTTFYSVGDIVSYNADGVRNYQLIRPYTGDFPTFPEPVDSGNPASAECWEVYTGSIQIEGAQAYPSPVLYDGSYTQLIDPTIQNGISAKGEVAVGWEGLGTSASAFRGMVYAVWTNLDLTGFSNRIPSIRAVVQSGLSPSSPPGQFITNLDDIVQDICTRCGVPPGVVDTTSIASVATTAADNYQADGSGIPALTMVQGGVVSFYQGTGCGAPFGFSYPNTDFNIPLPQPQLTFPLPGPTISGQGGASLIFNPYPADSSFSSLGYESFLEGWTPLASYNLLPMTLAGVVSGGGAGAATYSGQAWQPFTPNNVGSFAEANWDAVVTATFNVAVAGIYTFKVSSNDSVVIGMGGGATRVSGPMVFGNSFHTLTKSAKNGYPIVMSQNIETNKYLDGSGNALTGINLATGLPYQHTTLSTFTVSLPVGQVGIELDYACHAESRCLSINWMMGSTIIAGVPNFNSGPQSAILPIPGTNGADSVVAPFGFLVSDSKDGRSLIKTLQDAYFFDVMENEFALHFVLRGGSTSPNLMQIPQESLGLVSDKKALVETYTQEQDAPRLVIVNYVDPSLQYQQGSQQKQRNSRAVITLNQTTLDMTDLCISGTEARSMAEKTLFQTWMERLSYPINFGCASFALLDPTDVVDFVYENTVYQERLKSVSIGTNYAVQTSGVSQLPTAYASAVGGAPSSPLINVVEYALLMNGNGNGYITLNDGSHILLSN